MWTLTPSKSLDIENSRQLYCSLNPLQGTKLCTGDYNGKKKREEDLVELMFSHSSRKSIILKRAINITIKRQKTSELDS